MNDCIVIAFAQAIEWTKDRLLDLIGRHGYEDWRCRYIAITRLAFSKPGGAFSEALRAVLRGHLCCSPLCIKKEDDWRRDKISARACAGLLVGTPDGRQELPRAAASETGHRDPSRQHPGAFPQAFPRPRVGRIADRARRAGVHNRTTADEPGTGGGLATNRPVSQIKSK